MEENIKNNEKNTLSISNILFLLKKNMILVLIVTLAITIVGSIYSIAFKDTTYTSSATAMVVVPSSSSTSDGKFDYSYSLNLMYTFEEFIQSKAVSKKVSEKLSEKYDMVVSSNYVNSCIEVVVEQYSLVITINSTTTISKDFAIDLANEVINSTIYIINNELETTDGIKPLANKILIVDSAVDATASKGTFTMIIISFIIGLVVSLVVVLSRYFLNDTFTSKDEFERLTGVNVLVLLPDPIVAGGSKDEE